MTEHKFTDDEIIKALECCIVQCSTCRNCPLFHTKDKSGKCYSNLKKYSLDLINRQKAEIERIHRHTEMYHEVRAEAIREFAERVKSLLIIYTHINLNGAIDNLVKEMTEEKTKI